MSADRSVSTDRPQLFVVVDTEEEFDWSRPVSRTNVSTGSIAAQSAAHDVYDRFGLVPTYVVDYPVATDPAAVEFLAALRRQGKAEIGAHLHPWVSSPHVEEVNPLNSYHCNLPPALERAKIETLTATIEGAFGERPTIFKAGRHGFGPTTQQVLVDLGYEVDCSIVPHVSFAADGGPDFRGKPDQPYWLDRRRRLLEVPVTSGYTGLLAPLGPRLGRWFDHPGAQRLRLPGLLARTGLLERARLTPEGMSVLEQCRLLRQLVARGATSFYLVYHSPSLAPGHTPYVRSESDRDAFLANIAEVLTYFRDALGGRFTTIRQVYRQALDRLLREGDPAEAA
ncbi:polysaccharide deacetylase family protein [Sphingosinicella rhizophila]|uniref:Polysaccharide deacetylase family protein n=1 Tax=Sphingosinicella rhizophila TaxID=3050082 RepID=A0ABU3Q8Y0_9SPHN|nr:polysaccharide deacetylase family protein [Sphingosinicella sp. GR2756]MDT9599856.1 polysaccharide deacetylase family protein [Sphingosinicella sp. GR2756]